MKIELIEIAGFESAMRAMRLPMRSGDRSDSGFDKINPKTYDHIYPEHTIKYIKINEQNIYIGPDDLSLAQKLINAGTEHAKCIRGITVWLELTGPWYWFNELDTYRVGTTPMGSTSSMHIDCKGLTGEELQKAKSEIKGDYEYTRIWNFNYQSLRNIYFQRRSHRLPEWKQFCEFIETLPLSKELITI